MNWLRKLWALITGKPIVEVRDEQLWDRVVSSLPADKAVVVQAAYIEKVLAYFGEPRINIVALTAEEQHLGFHFVTTDDTTWFAGAMTRSLSTDSGGNVELDGLIVWVKYEHLERLSLNAPEVVNPGW